MSLSAWPSRRAHCPAGPMVSRKETSDVNARPDALTGPQPARPQRERPRLTRLHRNEISVPHPIPLTVTRHEYGAEHGGDWCGGAAQPVPAAGAVAPSAYPASSASVTATRRACCGGRDPGRGVIMNRP